jgi:hypothetical protein
MAKIYKAQKPFGNGSEYISQEAHTSPPSTERNILDEVRFFHLVEPRIENSLIP